MVLSGRGKGEGIEGGRGKGIGGIKGKGLCLVLRVSGMYDDEDKGVGSWYLLSKLEERWVKGGDISEWYYWGWEIECYFKLVKSGGVEVEWWLEESGEGYFKGLLIGCEGCRVVWGIMEGCDKE